MDTQALNQRIEQWQHMTEADPDNAMGWFSLGNAYKEADRDPEAAQALRKAIEIDGKFSRAYQILGQVLVRQKANDHAAEVLDKGYRVATEMGDVMPQRAMAELLKKIGKPVPEVAAKAQPVAVPEDGEQIVDRRTSRVGTRLTAAPFRGPMGQFVADHYSAQTWNEWIGQGTKVINELRLDFSKLEHQAVYDQHMMEWLGFTEAQVKAHLK